MGDSVLLDETGEALLTNGHASRSASEDSDITKTAPVSALKSNLLSNGTKKSSKNDTIKHHVSFSEENTVTEVDRNEDDSEDDDVDDEKDIQTVITRNGGVSHFTNLVLDSDCHPVYDIECKMATPSPPVFGDGGTISPMCDSGISSVSSMGHGSELGGGGDTGSQYSNESSKYVTYKGPVIRLQRWPSTDSHENPFQQDGELSKKAEFIVRNSTISRTEVVIADPDKAKAAAAAAAAVSNDSEVQEEPVLAQENALVQSAAPVAHSAPSAGGGSDAVDGPARPNDISTAAGAGAVKANGKVEDAAAVTPQSVEVEVGTREAGKPEAQQAEQVKLSKDKRGKCCVVQ